MVEPIRPRLLLQYLEPSPAVDAIDPALARDHLATALDLLPVTDLALGWRLRAELVEAVRSAVPAGVTVWRWVPLFVDSDESGPADPLVAVGPDGRAPAPFRDLADFRFLCLDQAEVVQAGLERATALALEIDAHGVLLDRIRWHSPSASPAAELTCFCTHSRAAAARDGLDLDGLAQELLAAGTTLASRRRLVAALLSRSGGEPIADFLDWRSATVTRAVRQVTDGLRAAGLRSALDVFTPALTRSVGQDLDALGGLGEWSKSMTYFEALGPAAMPFELTGYARWLGEAGEPDAGEFLADVLGFPAPGVGGAGVQIEALTREAETLVRTIRRERSVVGIDAVEIEGVCEVDDDDLDARIRALRQAGSGISPCWDLLLISKGRIDRIASTWAAAGSAQA